METSLTVKTVNTSLLYHLLLLNVSPEFLDKITKIREKLNCQETEETVALEEPMIILSRCT